MSTTGLSTPLINDNWTVELHKVLFPGQGEKPDHEWIPIVTDMGYAIITSDKKMRTWQAEEGKVRAVIERCSAKVFFLKGIPKEQATAIRKCRREMARLLKKCAGTYVIARIHSTGSRQGEIQVLNVGGSTPTEMKYGSKIRQEAEPTDTPEAT